MEMPFSTPRSSVRGRFARESKSVFFKSTGVVFSNRDSMGNKRLNIPKTKNPTSPAAEKTIQERLPTAAAFQS